jgi:hypothetical protein
MRTLLTTLIIISLFFVNTTPAHAGLMPLDPGLEHGKELAQVNTELDRLVSLSDNMMVFLFRSSREEKEKDVLLMENIGKTLLSICDTIVSQTPPEKLEKAKQYREGMKKFIARNTK